jgi:hypothetical protein
MHCTRCYVRYCGEACQRDDWTHHDHKSWCKTFAAPGPVLRQELVALAADTGGQWMEMARLATYFNSACDLMQLAAPQRYTMGLERGPPPSTTDAVWRAFRDAKPAVSPLTVQALPDACALRQVFFALALSHVPTWNGLMQVAAVEYGMRMALHQTFGGPIADASAPPPPVLVVNLQPAAVQCGTRHLTSLAKLWKAVGGADSYVAILLYVIPRSAIAGQEVVHENACTHKMLLHAPRQGAMVTTMRPREPHTLLQMLARPDTLPGNDAATLAAQDVMPWLAQVDAMRHDAVTPHVVGALVFNLALRTEPEPALLRLFNNVK